jgi:hypothetical protein
MPRLEIQIDMASTSEKIDIERTKKTAELSTCSAGVEQRWGKRADGAWPSAAHRRGESEIGGNNRARLGKAHARLRMSVEMLFNNSQNGSPSARRFAMCLDKTVFRGL